MIGMWGDNARACMCVGCEGVFVLSRESGGGCGCRWFDCLRGVSAVFPLGCVVGGVTICFASCNHQDYHGTKSCNHRSRGHRLVRIMNAQPQERYVGASGHAGHTGHVGGQG
jgi:hypothetical protein